MPDVQGKRTGYDKGEIDAFVHPSASCIAKPASSCQRDKQDKFHHRFGGLSNVLSCPTLMGGVLFPCRSKGGRPTHTCLH